MPFPCLQRHESLLLKFSVYFPPLTLISASLPLHQTILFTSPLLLRPYVRSSPSPRCFSNLTSLTPSPLQHLTDPFRPSNLPSLTLLPLLPSLPLSRPSHCVGAVLVAAGVSEDASSRGSRCTWRHRVTLHPLLAYSLPLRLPFTFPLPVFLPYVVPYP